METDDLALFALAARRGSLAAAARERGLDPSAVSRRVAALEARLGLKLFDRSARRLALTGEGRAALARLVPAAEALEAERLEIAAARGALTGPLTITASVAFGEAWLVPRLHAFRAAHPGVTLSLALSDAPLDLAAEGIDLAIRLGPRPTGEGVASRLMPTRYRVLASPAWLAAHGPFAAPADLEGRDALAFALPGYARAWRLRQGKRVEAIGIAPVLTASAAGALRRAAVEGMGMALLADWLTAEQRASGALVEVLPGWEASAARFDTAAWLLRRPGRPSARLAALRTHLLASVG